MRAKQVIIEISFYANSLMISPAPTSLYGLADHPLTFPTVPLSLLQTTFITIMDSPAPGSTCQQPVALQAVNLDVPYRDAVASWTVPFVQLQGEERFASFDLQTVSHVALQ